MTTEQAFAMISDTPAPVAEMLRNSTTLQLIELWEKTIGKNDSVARDSRAWVMNELYHRNPDAFLNWLHGKRDNYELRNYMLGDEKTVEKPVEKPAEKPTKGQKRYIRSHIGKDDIVGETAKAFKILVHYKKRGDIVSRYMTPIWLPKSCVTIGEPNQYGNCEITMQLWLYNKHAKELRFTVEDEFFA